MPLSISTVYTLRVLEQRMPYGRSAIAERLSCAHHPEWMFIESMAAACTGGDRAAWQILTQDMRALWVVADPSRAVDREPEQPAEAPRRVETLADLADNYKPDPSTAASLKELEQQMRQFWRWTGQPSSREVAKQSGAVFSHATVAKILYDRPGKPPLRLAYVQGFIRGCGTSPDEVRTWIAAWRRIHLAQPSTPDHRADQETGAAARSPAGDHR